jgi:hypothetical protein
MMLLCVPPDGGGDATPGVDTSPGCGGGDATPIVGMSPAKAETHRTQVRISAKPSRFMDFLLIENYPEIWDREIPEIWYRQINNKERFLAR